MLPRATTNTFLVATANVFSGIKADVFGGAKTTIGRGVELDLNKVRKFIVYKDENSNKVIEKVTSVYDEKRTGIKKLSCKRLCSLKSDMFISMNAGIRIQVTAPRVHFESSNVTVGVGKAVVKIG